MQKEGIYGVKEELENYEHEISKGTGEEIILVPGDQIERVQRYLTNAQEEEDYIRSIQRTKELIKQQEQEVESESSEGEGNEEELEQEKKWDCETILTTYTNTDNHPGVIKAIVKP